MKLKYLAFLPVLFGANVMAENATLDTEQQKLSYIFGIQVGQQMMMEGVELEMDAFSAGVADMMAGRQPQMDQATAQEIIGKYQQKKSQELAAMMNKKQAESKSSRSQIVDGAEPEPSRS